MLRSLHIENIALIRRMDIDFADSFTVLTGETGAGKSILIDSIGLLLGDRADRSLIRTGETEALVWGLVDGLSEGVWQYLVGFGIARDPEGSVLLSRQIYADGKSKARINGAAVSLSVLRSVGERLIGILGQSEHQMLRDETSYTSYLDQYAHTQAELMDYRMVYTDFCALSREIADLSRSESERLRTLEMLQYQIKDIDALSLKKGEDVALYEKEKQIKGAERLTKHARFVYSALKGAEKASADYIIERSVAALDKIKDIVPQGEEWIEKLRDIQFGLQEVSEAVYATVSDLDTADPAALLDKIETRLAAIERLKRKYGSSVDEILEYRRGLAERLDELENADARIEELQAKLALLRADLVIKAKALHDKRTAYARKLDSAVVASLEELDMHGVRFLASVTDLSLGGEKCDDTCFTQDGCDCVEFLISANKGEDLRSLAKVASGGELSRLMLALRTVMADQDGVGTLIFDEIDTGVSGKTARKLGLKLKQLASQVQVLCVTHSAQVASLGTKHYLIHKEQLQERTETFVSALDGHERINELARILGGISVTDAQRKAAEDMLNETY